MRTKVQRRKKTDKYDERVILWKDGEPHTFLVARLIALAWCDGYADGLTVNHIDGDTMNNHSENLEWITHKENIQKGFADGMYRTNQRECLLAASNGDVLCFVSHSDANRFLGKGTSFIYGMMKRGTKKITSAEGEEYRIIYPQEEHSIGGKKTL